jgi:hypothetical protein
VGIPGLLLVPRQGGRLTNAETVRLGRVLMRHLPTSHVSYPDDSPTVTVQVHGFSGDLSDEVAGKVAEIIGDFEARAGH